VLSSEQPNVSYKKHSDKHIQYKSGYFEVRPPHCVNQITKYKVDTESQNTAVLV